MSVVLTDGTLIATILSRPPHPPFSLCEQSGKLKRGDKVLMLGTGAGLTMAACTFTY